MWQQMSTLHSTSFGGFDELIEMESFSFNQPPLHPPPHITLNAYRSAENQTPLRESRALRRIYTRSAIVI